MNEQFEACRQKLYLTAYRMTGSVADAEDLVQDAYLRWRRTDTGQVRNAEAFLVTIITRLSIDHLRAARVRRESYAGQWLPEPLPTFELPAQERGMETMDTLSMAFMVLLERLNPVERAVYVLREVFDYSYSEVAAVVEKSQANCRKIFTRARERVGANNARFETDREKQRQLLDQFIETCESGDLKSLEALFAKDIALCSDGGKYMKTAFNIITTPTKVARFILGILGKWPGEVHYGFVEANGAQALVFYMMGLPMAVVCLDANDEGIHAVRLMYNLDKIGATLTKSGPQVRKINLPPRKCWARTR